ncbi:hypothetical protein H8959_000004 [Pygathrix nigripes]
MPIRSAAARTGCRAPPGCTVKVFLSGALEKPARKGIWPQGGCRVQATGSTGRMSPALPGVLFVVSSEIKPADNIKEAKDIECYISDTAFSKKHEVKWVLQKDVAPIFYYFAGTCTDLGLEQRAATTYRDVIRMEKGPRWCRKRSAGAQKGSLRTAGGRPAGLALARACVPAAERPQQDKEAPTQAVGAGEAGVKPQGDVRVLTRAAELPVCMVRGWNFPS